MTFASREAADPGVAASLVRRVRDRFNDFSLFVAVDDDESHFTEDAEGIWLRGWFLVAMEEMLPQIQAQGYKSQIMEIEVHEQETFVGQKGRWSGTWIRCWLLAEEEKPDTEDSSD